MEQLLLAFIDTLDQTVQKWLRQVSNQERFATLTLSQLQYIDAIDALDTPTLTDLAEQLGFSKPSVTTAVKKLLQLGYVQKRQSTADRRMFHLSLTAMGEELIAARLAALQAYSQFVQISLGESATAQFEASLARLITDFNNQQAEE